MTLATLETTPTPPWTARREVAAMADSVVVRALVKEFANGHRVLDGVDLSVGAGELVALAGANGSGKSTLLRCLVRLIEPTSGDVMLRGTDVTALSSRALRALRSRVGFVFQRFHLVGRLTAHHNVLVGALGRSGVRGWWPATASADEREEAMACLERVGLANVAERRASELSGGQQQRVAVARMLMQRPSLVLADEPVASLEPAAGAAVMELLRDVARERDLTVIVALHQLEYVQRYAERVVGLRAGQIALDMRVDDWRPTALEALYATD
jgi:phosphonate transport system ATP-binding protein